jgi:hypothetical protein
LNEDNVQKIEVKEHVDFRTIDITGAIGSFVGMRLEMILYSEHIDVPKGIVLDEINPSLKFDRTLECRLIIDPLTAKSIAQWLNRQVNAFEKQYGIIPTGHETQQNNQAVTQTYKKTTTGVG